MNLPDRIEELLPEICRESMTTREVILGRTKIQRAIMGRQALIVKLSGKPFQLNHSEIGRILSRHPSTILYALKRAQR
jgi:hypothetical protein